MNMMNDPRLRTDSYAKIFLYNTHETVACVPRHTIRMKDRVRPDKLREAVEQALLRFPHMMLSVERTETGFRYRTNVRPAVVLPFDGVSTRYTIGSADTNGYLFLVGYHEDTIYMEYQHSISDGRGFEEFIRCVLFQYLKNCGCLVENDGTVRAMIESGLTPMRFAQACSCENGNVISLTTSPASASHCTAGAWTASGFFQMPSGENSRSASCS